AWSSTAHPRGAPKELWLMRGQYIGVEQTPGGRWNAVVTVSEPDASAEPEASSALEPGASAPQPDAEVGRGDSGDPHSGDPHAAGEVAQLPPKRRKVVVGTFNLAAQAARAYDK
ncbi:hypothetical protein T484DRAFT_1764947, partial [Baffinella frigidus]